MTDKPKTFGRIRRTVTAAAVILVLALLVVTSRRIDFQSLLKQGLEWVDTLGPAGPAAFVVMYILACVLMIPGSILTLGAGVVFGVMKGTVTVSVASTLGATAAFLLGRYVARGWVSRKIEGNTTFAAVDKAVADDGWKLVGLMRLSPIFPFNLLNYSFGLTHVKLSHYFFASWAGMLPGTLVYVYAGSLATDVATLGATEQTKTPLQWAISAAGLVATVAVTVFVTRIAKRALADRLPEDQREDVSP